MNKLRYILYTLTAVLMMTACADDISEVASTPETDKGIGEMVLFTSGTTVNTVTTRADGDALTYYMPDTYHFICRMYYKAQTGSDKFDVSGNTDQTAWLKVNGNIGNSLYWNKKYENVGSNKGPGGVDEYGNDYDATAFYWQNRKEHGFLAWTDLNKAKTIIGGNKQGELKFGEDLVYKVSTGVKSEQWVTTGYKIYGIDQNFNSQAAMREYVESHYKDNPDALNDMQKSIGDAYDYSNAHYFYQYGWSCKYDFSNCDFTNIDETHRTYGWYQYLMFFDKIDFGADIDGLTPVMDKDGIVTHLKNAEGKYVAEAEVRKDADGNCLDKDNNVTTDPFAYTYNYYTTDEDGNVRYDESKPRFTFYYQQYQEFKIVDIYNEYPTLAFDLTRGTKESMAEQPDIAQAKEIQAPSGATQESNRVNLYFKHQFSQIQVNVKNAADNSVALTAGDIKKVELLGVSEEGYVFTELDEDGNVHPAAYKEIDFSKLSEQDLRDNQFGTSFNMFPMSEPATGYLRSFNCITFGQLQAIRITWKENETEIEHAATFRIPDTDLVNLQSSMKYIWNIEVRRGTLAVIRTEIVDWELPEDDDHNGNADGIIND